MKPESSTESPRSPRVLILDGTKLGSISATGQIKRTFFYNWRKDSIAQVYVKTPRSLCFCHPFSESEAPFDIENPQQREALVEACYKFEPQVIYFRPVPEWPTLFDIAREVQARRFVPTVIHVMDDVFSEINTIDHDIQTKFLEQFRQQWIGAVARLTVSPPMSYALKARFGLESMVLANGVEPSDWDRVAGRSWRDSGSGDEFVVRYAGALSERTSLSSIKDVAVAIEQIGAERAVRFEIITSATWISRARREFGMLRHTCLRDACLSDTWYRVQLMSSDCLIIAYNFSKRS